MSLPTLLTSARAPALPSVDRPVDHVVISYLGTVRIYPIVHDLAIVIGLTSVAKEGNCRGNVLAGGGY